MKRSRLWIPLLVLIVALLLGLAFLQSAPRLVVVSPQSDSAAVPASSPLRLTFSRPMDPNSVADHLSTDPPRRGTHTWDGNTLIFYPDLTWPSGQTVTVELAAGARATLGLPLLEGRTWTFRVSRPLLTYLWPADGPADIYALESIEGEIQRLTTTAHGVLEYSVSPDGALLYFAATNATGGSDLLRLDRRDGSVAVLLKCPTALCRTPRLSPQGEFLAYQSVALTSGGSAAQVRLLALSAGQPGEDRLVSDLSRPTDALEWSQIGWLAYHDADRESLVVYDPRSGEQIQLPNLIGARGSWSPDGRVYVAPDVAPTPQVPGDGPEGLTSSQLVRYNPLDRSAEQLTQQLNLEDTSPVFSPDGSLLAFARRYLDAPLWSLGHQLWVMQADGSGERPLTDDPRYNYTEFAWSPDSSQLAYMRFNQTTLIDPPEIWLINVDGREPIRLVIGGYNPQWIP